MKRTKFYIHSVWVEDIINGTTIGNIPDSVKLECFQAISHYGFYRNFGEVELSDMAKGLLAGIIPQLEGGWEAYEKQCERNRENGTKGGAPKGNRNAKKEEANENNPKQPTRLKSVVSIKHSDSDIDLDSDKIKNKIQKSKESANAPKKGETLSLKPSNGNSSFDERLSLFTESIRPYVAKYGKEMCNDFHAYWTEANKSKTKMRFELEKTWDIGRRLATWAKKDSTWNKAGKPVASTPRTGADVEGLKAGERIIEEKRLAIEGAHTPEAVEARERAIANLQRALGSNQPDSTPYIDDKHKFDNETGW